MPQTPPPTADAGADVTQIPRTGKERVMGAIGGVLSAGGGHGQGGSKLEQAVSKHYQARLDEAKMHRRNASTYAAVLATGINPQTGQPLTDQEKEQYQNWYNASWNAYQKIAGVTKETKGALQKGKAVLEHIIGRGQSQQPQGGPAAAPPGATTPQSQPSPAGGGAAGGAKQMTPPPTAGDL